MELQQILIVAIVAMAGLAVLRVVRVVRFGREPLPDGPGRSLFLLGFVVLPPLALGGPTSIPIYAGVLAAIALVMGLGAVVLDQLPTSRTGRRVRLALVGNEGEPIDRGKTPLTARLSEGIELVTKANAAFPRGLEFPRQIDRAGFRADWDALDGATRTLESRIADDHQLGLGVSTSATAVVDDARNRLDTLRRYAGDHGQAWARGTT